MAPKQKRTSGLGQQDNELLEFLGDSVVGLITLIFCSKSYPGLSEGQLSKLKS